MWKSTLIFLFIFISFESHALSTGTAFAVNRDGYLVTNHHVVEGAKTVIVRDYENRYFMADVVRSDEDADIAFLKISKSTPDYLSSNQKVAVKKGEKVYAIGFPHVEIQGGESKVTEGIINSLTGYKNDIRLFQISAEVQSGNSGGPLIRADGTLIGVVASKLSATRILKRTGDVTQNVNYAIKISEAEKLYPSLFKFQTSPKKQKNSESPIEKSDKAVYLVIASEFSVVKKAQTQGIARSYIAAPEAKVSSIQETPKNQNNVVVSVPEVIGPVSPIPETVDPILRLQEITNKGVQAYDAKNYSVAYAHLFNAADQGYAFAQYCLGLYYAKGEAVDVDYNKASFWFEKAAEQNITDAQYYIGNAYASGTGVKKDITKSIAYITKAAELGHKNAQLDLGLRYFGGIDVAKDYNLASKWFEKSAAQGSDLARTYLATIIVNSNDWNKEAEKVFNLYKQSAENSEPYAMYYLGEMYINGVGITQDISKGLVWLKKAAATDSLIAGKAQNQLGVTYAYGSGVEKSEQLAFEWFLKAANNNVVSAQEQVGWYYRNGKGGVAQDHSKAFEWFLAAADQGQVDSQVSVAWYYFNGIGGVQKSPEKSFEWNRKAADQGNAIAQYNIGMSYLNGAGIKQDYDEAAIWLKKAADNDNVYAQNNYGGLLALGPKGVKKDINEARKWFQKAADKGDKYALENLENLNRGIVAFKLY